MIHFLEVPWSVIMVNHGILIVKNISVDPEAWLINYVSIAILVILSTADN